MVGLRMADGVRRHVRNDEVGRAAERLDQRIGCGVVHEIHLEDIDSLDRLAGKQVDPGDARARIRLADNLRPAARRDAQVDDRARLLEQAEFFVDLDQLVDRKSVVEGKSVSVRVDLGGRRHIKKTKRLQYAATSTTNKK